MKNYGLISAILGRPWLLNPTWAEANLPLVAALLNGEAVSLPTRPKAWDDDDDDEESQGPRVKVLSVVGGTVRPSYYRSFDEAPKGSVALIPVVGPIAKYYNCGVPGSTDLAQWTRQANESDRIEGIVYDFDTPGGMVDGTANFADEIKASTKPTVGHVGGGMAASAGMWLISACDEIILSQPTDSVGSIGVFTQLRDFSGWFEKQGIKVHDIYAPQSVDKNKDYYDALKGDQKAVKDQLAFLAETFINAVKANRGDKINLEAGDPFTGKMYYAEDAIAIGLADRIGTIEDAMASVYDRVGTKTSNSNSRVNMSLFGNKLPRLYGLKGKKAEEVSDEDIAAVNAELEGEGINAVSVVPASFEADAERLVAENATLNQVRGELATANRNLTAAQEALTAEQSAHATTRSELDALKDNTAADKKVNKDPGEDPDTTSTDDEFYSSANERLKEIKSQMQ